MSLPLISWHVVRICLSNKFVHFLEKVTLEELQPTEILEVIVLSGGLSWRTTIFSLKCQTLCSAYCLISY